LVPSGGDWALHPSGAVFLDGVENITISNNFFNQVGNNGVYMSNYARYNTIVGNEFWRPGESAVLAVGTCLSMIVDEITLPAYNTIAYNHIHDIGIFGKQTSGFTMKRDY
jgi:hypothetical protein